MAISTSRLGALTNTAESRLSEEAGTVLTPEKPRDPVKGGGAGQSP
jgi:hypothetical protein